MAALIALLAAPVYAAEQADKDLTILRLQKIIAEQTMGELLRDSRVSEYERIRQNYQKLLGEIEKQEKTPKKNPEQPEYSPRDWGEK
jgi:hypothetical protein